MVSVKAKAVQLLAIREHSQLELKQKLLQKGYALSEIEPLLVELNDHQLQSEARFVESFVRSRMQSGYGPLRIKRELELKGVCASAINEVLDDCSEEWITHLHEVCKKYKRKTNAASKDKLYRFLMYRGFAPSMISRYLKSPTHE